MGRKSKEQLRKEYISRIRSEAGKKGGGWKLTKDGRTRHKVMEKERKIRVCHKGDRVVIPVDFL